MRPVLWIPTAIVAACIVLGGFAVLRPRPQQPAAGPARSSVPDAGTAEPAVPDVSLPAAAAVTPGAAAAAVSELLAGQHAYAAGDVDGAVQPLQAAGDANPDDPP